jgi:hypothetical protein
MPGLPIPDDARRFLLSVIPSVPHLEALLLLRGSPGPWPIPQLAGRLYIDAIAARALVDDLVVAGLATCSADGCQYAPADAATATTVDAVAGLYAQRTVAVAELIHSTSDRKALRFADAFRLRKEP